MKPVLKTTDPVRLSYARSLLDDAGIEYLVADEHISAIEGSIGIFPRRLMVIDEEESRALAALKPLFDAEAQAGRDG
jgi:hypothetical protein